MDEINVLKNLDNPHIVHVWDHFESRDKYYIAFELAIGGELFDRITERGRFTEKDAGDCIRCVRAAAGHEDGPSTAEGRRQAPSMGWIA